MKNVKPDGYWYRIQTAPWSDAFYAPANTFMNGDPVGGPSRHNVDWRQWSRGFDRDGDLVAGDEFNGHRWL